MRRAIRARASARRCGAGPLPFPPCIGCKLCLRDRRVEPGTEAPRRLGTRASAFLGRSVGSGGPPRILPDGRDLPPTRGGAIARGHEGRMQTEHLTAYAGSGLKPLMIREGTAWRASLPAVLGKTRRTE